ncbi:serine protease inhibitor 77Ba-like [Maniola hyperantus]|uniref:serine protease inhibitor 77Ba-like n=1 Tax=Aphantopus hyperantus TaxID=2795564 RepID=UPI00156A2A09|nr:serine protease inhibitor 77Ba-like [Maniola hyperantus]
MTSIMLIMLLTFLVASCNCAVEFSSRPRNFSIEIFFFTQREGRLDHFVMSPFCIWSVMTGAYAGAHGDTNTQIQRATGILKNHTLFLKRLKDLSNTLFQSTPNGVELSSTTFLFQDKDVSVLQSYKTTLNRSYKAQLRILDFQDTLETANQANRVIQNIFPTVSNVFHADDFAKASLILGNVIYFRGILKTPFNVSYTTEEIIYDEKNKSIGSISMMHQKGKLPYSNFETMNSYILELPYGNDEKFCMLVIFPYPGVRPIDVYRNLDKIYIKDILTKLETDFKNNGSQEIDVKMPRFRIRTSMPLRKPLNDMGVFDAFEPDLGRFEDISRDGLYIHSVEHKAEIIFAESETVVFATTPGYFDNQPFSSNLKAQQPFIFFLIEKPTATIIFAGIYSRHRYLNDLNSRILFNDD